MNDKTKVCSQHSVGVEEDATWGLFWRENGLDRCRFHLNTVNTAVQGIMGGRSDGGPVYLFIEDWSDFLWLLPLHPEMMMEAGEGQRGEGTERRELDEAVITVFFQALTSAYPYFSYFF